MPSPVEAEYLQQKQWEEEQARKQAEQVRKQEEERKFGPQPSLDAPDDVDPWMWAGMDREAQRSAVIERRAQDPAFQQKFAQMTPEQLQESANKSLAKLRLNKEKKIQKYREERPWEAAHDKSLSSGERLLSSVDHNKRRLADPRYDQEYGGEGDRFTRGVLKRLPVSGAIWSAMSHKDKADTTKRIAEGKGSDADYMRLGMYVAEEEHKANRTGFTKALDIASYIPGYATEMFLTGGAYGAGRAATQRAAIKGFGRAGLIGGEHVARGVPTAIKAAGFVGGTARQAASPFMWGRAADEFLSRRDPGYKLKGRSGSRGRDVVVKEHSESIGRHVYEAMWSHYLEIMTERSGATLMKGAGAPFRALTARLPKTHLQKVGAAVMRKSSEFSQATGMSFNPFEEYLEEMAGSTLKGSRFTAGEDPHLARLWTNFLTNPTDPQAQEELWKESGPMLGAFAMAGVGGGALSSAKQVDPNSIEGVLDRQQLLLDQLEEGTPEHTQQLETVEALREEKYERDSTQEQVREEYMERGPRQEGEYTKEQAKEYAEELEAWKEANPLGAALREIESRSEAGAKEYIDPELSALEAATNEEEFGAPKAALEQKLEILEKGSLSRKDVEVLFPDPETRPKVLRSARGRSRFMGTLEGMYSNILQVVRTAGEQLGIEVETPQRESKLIKANFTETYVRGEARPAATEPDIQIHNMTLEEFRKENYQEETEWYLREKVMADGTKVGDSPERLLRLYEERYPELAALGLKIGGIEATEESGPTGNSAGIRYRRGKDGKKSFQGSTIHLAPDAGLVAMRHEIEHALDHLHGFDVGAGERVEGAVYRLGAERHGRFDHKFFNRADYLHRALVRDALLEGEQVSEEVLAQYKNDPAIQELLDPAPATPGAVAPAEVDQELGEIDQGLAEIETAGTEAEQVAELDKLIERKRVLDAEAGDEGDEITPAAPEAAEEKHEQTIEEHIAGHLAEAIDQAQEYEFAGDSYLQNLWDTVREDGYSGEEALAAGDAFTNRGIEAGLRFLGEEEAPAVPQAAEPKKGDQITQAAPEAAEDETYGAGGEVLWKGDNGDLLADLNLAIDPSNLDQQVEAAVEGRYGKAPDVVIHLNHFVDGGQVFIGTKVVHGKLTTAEEGAIEEQLGVEKYKQENLGLYTLRDDHVKEATEGLSGKAREAAEEVAEEDWNRQYPEGTLDEYAPLLGFYRATPAAPEADPKKGERELTEYQKLKVRAKAVGVPIKGRTAVLQAAVKAAEAAAPQAAVEPKKKGDKKKWYRGDTKGRTTGLINLTESPEVALRYVVGRQFLDAEEYEEYYESDQYDEDMASVDEYEPKVENTLNISKGGLKVLAGLQDQGNRGAEALISHAKKAVEENPEDPSIYGWWSYTQPREQEMWEKVLIPQLRELGYDSIAYQDDVMTGKTLAVFSLDQLSDTAAAEAAEKAAKDVAESEEYRRVSEEDEAWNKEYIETGTIPVKDHPTLPSELKGAKPRYNIGQTSYTPQFESDIDRALFIVARAKMGLEKKKAARDADYLAWLQWALPGLSEAEIRTAGLDVKEHIKNTVKGKPEGDVNIPFSEVVPVDPWYEAAVEKPTAAEPKKGDKKPAEAPYKTRVEEAVPIPEEVKTAAAKQAAAVKQAAEKVQEKAISVWEEGVPTVEELEELGMDELRTKVREKYGLVKGEKKKAPFPLSGPGITKAYLVSKLVAPRRDNIQVGQSVHYMTEGEKQGPALVLARSPSSILVKGADKESIIPRSDIIKVLHGAKVFELDNDGAVTEILFSDATEIEEDGGKDGKKWKEVFDKFWDWHAPRAADIGQRLVQSRLYKQYFNVGGLMGKDLHTQLHRLKGKTEANVQAVRQQLATLERAVKDSPWAADRKRGQTAMEAVSKENLKVLNGILKIKIEEMDDYGKKHNIPEGVIPVAKEIRKRINSLSTDLQDLFETDYAKRVGLEKHYGEDLLEIFATNEGVYLRRSYELFNNPDYGKKLLEADPDWTDRKGNKVKLLDHFKELTIEGDFYKKRRQEMRKIYTKNYKNALEKDIEETLKKERERLEAEGLHVAEIEESLKKGRIDLWKAAKDRVKREAEAKVVKMTDKEANDHLHEILAQERGEQASLRTRSSLGRADMNTLIKRRLYDEHFHQVLRRLYGEIDEFAINALATVERISSIIQQTAAQEAILEHFKQAKWVDIDPETGEPYTRSTYTDGVQYGPKPMPKDQPEFGVLQGLYLTRDAKQALIDYYGNPSSSKEMTVFERLQKNMWFKMYGQTMGLARASKTILSTTVQWRNFWANATLGFVNGHFSLDGTVGQNFIDAFAVTASSQGRFKWTEGRLVDRDGTVVGRKHVPEIVEELLARDVIFDTPSNEIEALLDAAWDMPVMDLLHDGMKPVDQKGMAGFIARIKQGSGWNKVWNTSAALYRAGDDIWKVFGWLREVQVLEKAFPTIESIKKVGTYKKGPKKGERVSQAKLKGDTEADRAEWIKDEAALRIRDMYPTFSNAPFWVKAVRWFPLVGTFPTYFEELIRTQYIEFFKMTARDIQSGNSVLARRAIERRVRWVATHAALGATIKAILSLLVRIFGCTPIGGDDEDLLREGALPPWSKNSSIFAWRCGKGDPKVLDLSFVLPTERPWDAVRAAISEESFIDKGLGVLNELAGEFSTDMAVMRGIEAFHGVTSGGGDLFKESDSTIRKTIRRFMHLYGIVEPGVAKSMIRIFLGLAKKPGVTGKPYNPGVEALSAITGTRINNVKIAESLDYQIAKFNRNLRGSRREMERFGVSDYQPSMLFPLDWEGSLTQFKRELPKAERARKRVFSEGHNAVELAQRMGMSRRDIVLTLKKHNLSRREIGALLNKTYQPYLPSKPMRAKILGKGYAGKQKWDTIKEHFTKEIEIEKKRQKEGKPFWSSYPAKKE